MTALSTSDLDRLEELARAATPGKMTAFSKSPNALFMAACDAETILALVAQARRAPRWIPVKERLPEEGVSVAVIEPPHSNVTGAMFCGEAGWRGDCDRFIAVTHWMPLPEPPEPKS